MKKYYIVINGVKKGPFTLNDLKGEELTPSTLVWTHELKNWTEAKNVEELNSIITALPPPIPKTPDKAIIVIATEIQINFLIALFAVTIGAISYPIYFTVQDGFTQQIMVYQLQNHFEKHKKGFSKLSEESKQELYKRTSELQIKSKQLGNPDINLSGSFDIVDAISYHKNQVKDANGYSFSEGFRTSLIVAMVLVFGRYLFKVAKFINDNSKKIGT